MEKSVVLSSFDASSYNKGGNFFTIIAWYFINALFVRASWNPFMKIKVWLLKIFGAKIGKGLVLKNNVTIKYPWNLTIRDNVWIGENVWIDNLDKVTISDNVCISQGALLLTGNHDYTKSSFDYRNAPIILEEGVWIGAKSVVCPGVTAHSHSILTVGSIATHNLEAYTISQGNPAKPIRKRIINS